MRPEDAKKLLGGYATGTLTDAEQEALFAAALDDQELFDALAREQSLREVLRDPGVKAELLAALDDRPKAWWSWRPAAVLAVAGLAAVAVVVLPQKAPPPVIVAQVDRAPAPPVQIPDQTAPVASAVPDMPASPRRKPGPHKQPSAGAPGEKQGFERSPVLADAPRVKAEAVAPPPPPQMPLLPSENAAPRQAKLQVLTAAATGAVRISARDLFYGTPAAVSGFAADVAVRRTLAVRYTIVRKEGDSFVEADPDGIQQGDTVALRFTANANGYLSIDGATPVAITAMQPYTTPAVDAAEVKVVFARTPETSAEGSVVTERRERETFVANTLPGSAMGFSVALPRR
jgi:hypothetical protein